MITLYDKITSLNTNEKRLAAGGFGNHGIYRNLSKQPLSAEPLVCQLHGASVCDVDLRCGPDRLPPPQPLKTN